MKKSIWGFLLIALVVFTATNAQAATDIETFTVSATVPSATGTTFGLSSVDPDDNSFTTLSGTVLNFDPLTLNTNDDGTSLFLPDHFFAIDVGTVGGAGTPTVTINYIEGSNPNASAGGNGLGYKATSTFVRVEGAGNSQTETALTAHGPKKLLKDLVNEVITSSEIVGGFLRMYVGIVTLDPSATFPDPTGAEPFTLADVPGTYTGSYIVTSVLP